MAFKNRIIQKHNLNFINTTKNILWYSVITRPLLDKKRPFPPSMNKSLGLPKEIKNMYDYQMKYGDGYGCLSTATVIAICSNVESLLKDVCESLYPGRTFHSNVFQKVTKVNDEYLEPKEVNISSCSEFDKILKCFQIRHISIHNMGVVDTTFKTKTSSILAIGDKYEITKAELTEFIEAFEGLTKYLDDALP